MKLEQAHEIALAAVHDLMPFCDRIEIAGSIRRGKAEPKDIEIVCIPSTIMDGLFADDPQRHPGFITAVRKWKKIKGTACGKYTQRQLPEPIVLDLFMVTPDTWGTQLALRTGPAEYSHQVLACTWSRRGMHLERGILYHNITGKAYTFPEEQDLFNFLGIPWTEPSARKI